MWLSIRLGVFARYLVPVLATDSDELAALIMLGHWRHGGIQFALGRKAWGKICGYGVRVSVVLLRVSISKP